MQFRKTFILVVMIMLSGVLLSLPASADSADTAVLPADLAVVEEEAFFSASLTELLLPEGVREIHARAFAENDLTAVDLPSSLTYIADDAFDGPEKLTVTAEENSYAYRWAVKNGYIVPFTYVERDDGTLEITGYTGGDTVVYVPAAIGGKPVAAIGDAAFRACGSLERVVLPETISSIGSESFGTCSSLSQINIPSNVTSIGREAFIGCAALERLELPDGITFMGSWAVSGTVLVCNRNSVTAHAAGSFCFTSPGEEDYLYEWKENVLYLHQYKGSAAEVTLPDWIDALEVGCFSENGTLRQIALHEGIETIPDWAFRGCGSLERAVLPESISSIGEESFWNCENLTQINIPSNVTSIGREAFIGCAALEQLELPDGITFMGSWAVSGTVLVCNRNSVTAHTAGSFCFTSPGEEDYLYEWKENVLYLHQYRGASAEVTLPDWIDALEVGCFSENGTLRQIALHEGIETIPDWAFRGCGSLERAVLPESISSIGEESFWNCGNLTQINIPSNVTSIGREAFIGCAALEQLDLPDEITFIGSWAVSGTMLVCERNSVTAHTAGSLCFTSPGEEDYRYEWKNNRLYLNKYVGKAYFLELPAWIDELEPYAFMDSYTIETVEFNSPITSIPEGAFFNCVSLEYLFLPDSVTSIENNAFSQCRSLRKLLVPQSVVSIQYSAFQGMQATIYVYPDSFALSWCEENEWGHTVLYPMTASVYFYPKRLAWTYQPYYSETFVESGIPPYSARYTFFQNRTPLYSTPWETNNSNATYLVGYVFYPMEEDHYSVSVEVKDFRGVIVTAISEPIAPHTPTEQELDAEKAKLFHDKLMPVMNQVKEPAQFQGVHYYRSLGSDWSMWMAAISALTLDLNSANTFSSELDYLIVNALKSAAHGDAALLVSGDGLPAGLSLITGIAEDTMQDIIERVLDTYFAFWTNASEREMLSELIADVCEGTVSVDDAVTRMKAFRPDLDYTDLKNKVATTKKISKLSLALKGADIANAAYHYVADILNQLALFECLDAEQLIQMAEAYCASDNAAAKDAGRMLLEFCTASETERILMTIAGKAQRFFMNTLQTAADFGGKAFLVYQLTVTGIDAMTGVSTLAKMYQELNYAVNSADAIWDFFKEKRHEYALNPSPETSRAALYALKNYHTAIERADKQFYNLVRKAQEYPLHDLYLGEPMVNAAAKASTNAAQQHAMSEAVDQLINLWQMDLDTVSSSITRKINNYQGTEN